MGEEGATPRGGRVLTAVRPSAVRRATGGEQKSPFDADEHRGARLRRELLPAIRQVHLLTDHVRQILPAVTAPALVLMSRDDRSVKFESAEIVMDEIGSQDKTLITLTESGHNPLIDREREYVYAETARFFLRVSDS